MPLSFFSNYGGAYGSAIPFQRIVEPAQLGMFLNLEQAELLRIQRYNEGWRFYFGRQWVYKREDGDPLVTWNYYRKLVNKSVSFLVRGGFEINVPEALEEVTKPYLDEVWSYNKKEALLQDIALMGAVTGDVFLLITYEEPSEMQRRINPFSEGRTRLQLLGSEQVFPTWDPLNTDTLIAVRIETIYYAERGARQLDRDDRVNHEGRQLYTKRFTQIITPDQIVEQFHGDMPVVRPNALGEISMVHIKNDPIPREYYGLSDGQDLIDIQREMNEKATDISDVVNYHAAPTVVIFGAKAKELERSAKQIWSGLPVDARVETLQSVGELGAATSYLDRVKRTMHELSDIPEGALGGSRAISNTSGVALNMEYLPLIEKTDKKVVQYSLGLQQINYFILRIAVTMGMVNLPYDICKSCGGRIIELDTGATTMVWDRETKQYVQRPLTKKRCYHINKQTLDFLDPYEMRVKFWRQYGFGAETREVPWGQVEREILTAKTSFWDYTELQRVLRERFAPEPIAPSVAPPETTPLGASENEGEGEGEGGAEVSTETPNASEPTPEAPEIPPILKDPGQLKLADFDIPEEPEDVDVVQTWLHPETGEVLSRTTVKKTLVPTGCLRPVYLNPFETEIAFGSPLPKDDVLEATLYEQYQRNGWVDEVWVRQKIQAIRKDAKDIERRMKERTSPISAASAPGQPAGGAQWNAAGMDPEDAGG